MRESQDIERRRLADKILKRNNLVGCPCLDYRGNLPIFMAVGAGKCDMGQRNLFARGDNGLGEFCDVHKRVRTSASLTEMDPIDTSHAKRQKPALRTRA